MKKMVCFVVFVTIGVGLYAFDRSLNGSWGLVVGGQKQEFARFNNDEILIMNTLFRSTDYTEADDTIYIADFERFGPILKFV